MKKMVKRWLIIADDTIVDIDYVSEEKARRKAFYYAHACENQDIPYFPVMRIEEETLS